MRTILSTLCAVLLTISLCQVGVAEQRVPPYPELPLYPQTRVTQIAFSPSGKLCASAGPAGVRVWEVVGQRTLIEAAAHLLSQSGQSTACFIRLKCC